MGQLRKAISAPKLIGIEPCCNCITVQLAPLPSLLPLPPGSPLHTYLHLLVSFLGNLTCDSWYQD